MLDAYDTASTATTRRSTAARPVNFAREAWVVVAVAAPLVTRDVDRMDREVRGGCPFGVALPARLDPVAPDDDPFARREVHRPFGVLLRPRPGPGLELD